MNKCTAWGQCEVSYLVKYRQMSQSRLRRLDAITVKVVSEFKELSVDREVPQILFQTCAICLSLNFRIDKKSRFAIGTKFPRYIQFCQSRAVGNLSQPIKGLTLAWTKYSAFVRQMALKLTIAMRSWLLRHVEKKKSSWCTCYNINSEFYTIPNKSEKSADVQVVPTSTQINSFLLICSFTSTTYISSVRYELYDLLWMSRLRVTTT